MKINRCDEKFLEVTTNNHRICLPNYRCEIAKGYFYKVSEYGRLVEIFSTTRGNFFYELHRYLKDRVMGYEYSEKLKEYQDQVEKEDWNE